jgi:CheY-like chemotaxis protein
MPAEDDRAALTDTSRVVLVIEDDRVFSGILRDLAHELQFQCVITHSAQEGLELARGVRPLAIILDMGLPDHSGLTVLEMLKRDASARHIPIHAVSVHDYQRVAREMGAVGYALKPVKREELVAAFHRLEQRIARKTRSVLVIEDDAVQRDAITRLLKSDGVTMTAVSNAEEALAKLDTETFDCVVLDLNLQGTSGFDLLGRLAQREERSLPPVVIYTARALTLEEEQRLRQHAKSIIIKGARSPERLLEEVTLFLHQFEGELPEDQRRMLRAALDRESKFIGRRILIVEDDVRSVFALTSALEPKGAVIEIARNGREAHHRIEAPPPVDIVLMDVMMPEMDGLAATREIRKQPHWSSLPIIALTAKAMPDDRQQCLEAGANDYIAKPINVEKLISLVRVWMPR